MKRPLFEPTPPAAKRPRTLSVAQRKALEVRVKEKQYTLERRFERDQGMVKEPPKVVAARKVIEQWEAEQDAAREAFYESLRKESKHLYNNLLFDSVDDSLRQVSEFEEMAVNDFK